MLPKHHAFVAYGSPSKLKEFAAYIAKEVGVTAVGNPDFHIHNYSSTGDEDATSFGVEESDKLIHISGQKSVGGIKVFVIAANSLTRESQNALLKTLEEPKGEVVFAFLVPHGSLIETVRSRLIVLPWKPREIDNEFAASFLAASPDKRSTLIASLLKDKDKEGARELLDALERLLEKDIARPETRAGLTEVARMRSYIMDRSPSLKMILEHLALVLPRA